MSTQSAVSVPDVPLIDDKPPAGTPCLPCKKLGHWCPAAKYIGQTDDGICKDCAEQKNCQVAARQKQKEYDVFDVPLTPAPVRHIPPPTKQEQYEAARAENVRAALAGEVGRDAVKTPVAAKQVTAVAPLRVHDIIPPQIAGKFAIGVARLRRELDVAKEKPKVVLSGIPKTSLQRDIGVLSPEETPAILPVELTQRKPLFDAMDDVIAHLEAEIASIRDTVEMLKKRRGAS